MATKAISKKWDPVSNTVPVENKFEDHPGLEVSNKAIPESPGSKETNTPGSDNYNKAHPFGGGGAGYTSKH